MALARAFCSAMMADCCFNSHKYGSTIPVSIQTHMGQNRPLYKQNGAWIWVIHQISASDSISSASSSKSRERSAKLARKSAVADCTPNPKFGLSFSVHTCSSVVGVVSAGVSAILIGVIRSGLCGTLGDQVSKAVRWWPVLCLLAPPLTRNQPHHSSYACPPFPC